MIRIRAVGVTLPAFDPFCGAKLSMCTALSLGRQIPRNGSRRSLDRLADIVDQPLDQRRVIALGHHPDQRLGPRLADDQAPAALELALHRGDSFPDAVGFERLYASDEGHVLEEMGLRFEPWQQFACWRFDL